MFKDEVTYEQSVDLPRAYEKMPDSSKSFDGHGRVRLSDEPAEARKVLQDRRHSTYFGISIPSLIAPQGPDYHIPYLLGLRGMFSLSTFLCLFLLTFAPSAIKDSKNFDGPEAAVIIRKILSVPFWNPSLTYSAFVFLLGRTLALPFLNDPTRKVLASSTFRRPFRLAIPAAIGFGIAAAILNPAGGRQMVSDFINATDNKSIIVPTPVPDFLVYLNSVFNLFWTPFQFDQQNGNTAFPGQVLWIISVIFQQSYTLYMTMLVIPYTRPVWRLQALAIFALCAWWVQSWAWYSISGLFIADAVSNYDLRGRLQSGFSLGRLTIPSWVLCFGLMVIGYLQEYLYVIIDPSAANGELWAHGGIYNGAKFNEGFNPDAPQPRIDNFCVCLGGFLLLECAAWTRKAFSFSFLTYLGERSYSKSRCILSLPAVQSTNTS